MKRHACTPRKDWQKEVESQGFTFHTAGKRPDGTITSGTYWAEDAFYEPTTNEVDEIEQATKELHERCIETVRIVCTKRTDLLSRLGIPREFHRYVCQSFERNDPAVYGRFDLAYDGSQPPKLLEYNADTPTTLLESSVIQWHWLEDVFAGNSGADQFNSIHEKLIERWKALQPRMKQGSPLYFLAVKDNQEEFATVEYLRDTTAQAGLESVFLHLEDLGWDATKKRFVDLDNLPVDHAFKLYPWEWMFSDEFAPRLIEARNDTGFIEPPWKALLSNKGILPILWELFPEHPNLLPAFWEPNGRLGDSWIAKPMLGREGANMTLVTPKGTVESGGSYANSSKIYQQLAKLSQIDGMYASIGSWVVGDEPAGICFREDTSPIIVDKSRFVPHMFFAAQ
jgi:glutathionylspermidine synthase